MLCLVLVGESQKIDAVNSESMKMKDTKIKD